MIEFNCPHCGNHFRVKDNLAGQEGWCRVCNGHIVIPGKAGPVQTVDMAPEEKVSHLEKSLRMMGARYAKHLNAMSSLVKDNEALREEVESMREMKKSARSTEARWKESEAMNNRLAQELSVLAAEKGRFEERFTSADTAIQKLDRELESLRKAHEAREVELLREIDQARARLAEGDSLAQRLQTELSVLSGLPNAGEERLSLLTNELDRATRELALEKSSRDEAIRGVAQLEGKIAALQQDQTFFQTELRRAQEKIESAKAHETELSFVRKGNTTLIEQLQASHQEVDRLKQSLHMLERQIEKDRADHGRRVDELEALLKADALQLGKYRDDLVAMTMRVQEAETESQRLRAEMNALNASAGNDDLRVKQLGEQVEKLTDELKMERTGKTKAERNVSELELKATALEQRTLALESERDRLSSLADKLVAAEVDLGIARGKLSELEEKTSASAAETTRALRSIEEARLSEGRAREEVVRLKSELERAGIETAQLKKEIADLQRTASLVSVYKEEKGALEEKLESLRLSVSRVQYESTTPQKQNGVEQADMERALRDMAALKSDLAAEKSARTASESELRAAVLKTEYSETLVKSLQRELDESRERLSRMAESEVRLSASLKKLEESQDTVGSMSREIQRLSESFAAAEARREEAQKASAEKPPQPEMKAEKSGTSQSAWAETDEDDEMEDEDLTLIPEIIDEKSQHGKDAMSDALFRFIERE